MEKQTFETEVAGKALKIQIGELADQASGSCLVRYGDTSVLCTAQIGEERPEMGFFPLTCDHEERFYAAGKILGSRFVRREGRPSTEAVLNARLIDRAIRPRFPKGLMSEIQVIATCLSWDGENDPAILGLIGASLALGLSEIPWQGPIGAVRVGRVNQEFVLNPNYEQREQGELDLVLVGIDPVRSSGAASSSSGLGRASNGVEKDGEILINMIEAKANEVTEQVMLEAYDLATPLIKQTIEFQNKIIAAQGKEKLPVVKQELDKKIEQKLKGFLGKKLEEALYQEGKQRRNQDWLQLQDEMLVEFEEELGEEHIQAAKDLFIEETEKLFKENILKHEKRPDGRKMDEIRPLSCEVGFLPRTHGSGMFVRGETRILSILTLGAPGDQQLVEGMEISGKKRFLHHYNFPPYSSGEVKRLGSPGRREIGHGMLAERAVTPLLPSIEEFPYTIRIVSEALSSNGSTSMGSVSGACLALMDAGVPITRPAAGIAVGLVVGKTLDEFKLLTDIQGPEDHHGEMDLKVAGTQEGITVVQMDVKTDGITREIMEVALERGKKARKEVLEVMKQTLPSPRKELSPYAPKIYILKINPDKIGAVIGPGGKVINEIIDECGVTIDIEDSGQVFITAEKKEAAEKAVEWVKNLAREFKVGEGFQSKVVSIAEFGAFVELTPGKDGLVHISELAPFRVNRVEDVVKVGDIIPVKVINIDEQGRIGLSARQAGFKPKSPQGKPGPPQRKPRPPFRRR